MNNKTKKFKNRDGRTLKKNLKKNLNLLIMFVSRHRRRQYKKIINIETLIKRV